MDFRLAPRAAAVSRLRFEVLSKGTFGGSIGESPRPPVPVGRGEEDGAAGPARHHHRRERRRPGRHRADGRGARDRSGRRSLARAAPTSSQAGNFGADPGPGRVWFFFPKTIFLETPSDRRSGHLRGHDRARGRLRGHRPGDESDARTARAWRVNGSKIFTTHFAVRGSRSSPTCSFGPGVGGIGSVLIEMRSRFAGERPRTSCPARNGRSCISTTCRVPEEMVLLGEGGFKKQIAGFNVERIGNAARSLALGRYAFEQARASWALRASSSASLLARVPGPAVEIRRHEAQARGGAAAALPRRRQRRPRPALAPTRPRSPRLACNQAGFEVAQRSAAGDGRHRLQPATRWSSTACAAAAAG